MTDGPPESGFIPIHPNPYIVGNPVRERAMFFGREAEFELVRRRFQDSAHGGLMVFCGERRSGKTSILFQILDGRLGPAFIPVLIDMQSMAVASEAEFLTRVSEEVCAALGQQADGMGPPTFSTEANHSATFQRFVLEVLRARHGRKLILLFDEYELFENKIDTGLLKSDVLHILAGLIESHPVFVVFTGSQHLEQRKQDYWKILGKSLHKRISFLERDDALSLIRKPVEGRVRFDDAAVEAIWRLTAGQPFYTQAICQSMVDQLNERRSASATPETLSAVVDGIVNNPLPQMIFLWDGLERAEKLVLALVAEQLVDATTYCSADDLARLLKQRQYPLDLHKASIATTLEKLFQGEMLLRKDHGSRHEYAFRMDLWRLWVRRQHSVWQVMREEGLEIRRRTRPPAAIALAVLAALAIPALLFIWWRSQRPQRAQQAQEVFATPMAMLALDVDPDGAAILLDGRPAGAGAYRGSVFAGQDHHARFSAAGFADSELVFRIAAGDSGRKHVVLRELFGDLRIETRPTGAEISVDGKRVGRSPTVLHRMPTGRSLRLEATLAGHGAARQEVLAKANLLIPVSMVLETATAGLMVTTEPSGSEVRIDGQTRGSSPLSIEGLTVGRHAISAHREGYVDADTTLSVIASDQRLHLALRIEPPGFLEVKGDRPAEIWIDGALVVANVQNSGVRQLAPGPYQVRVVFANGEAIDQSVAVKSRERATYDYSARTVTRRQEGP